MTIEEVWKSFSDRLGYDATLYCGEDPLDWPTELNRLYKEWYASIPGIAAKRERLNVA